jgi:hypothetical protein
MTRTVPLRVLLLIPAGLSLLAGLDAGLFRIGWALPLPQLDLPLAHGPLMVSGFLGTLIGLEKAVAIQKKWAYLCPLATGIGGIALAVATASIASRLLFLGGSSVLVAVSCLFFRRSPTLAQGSMLAGVVLWVIGNGLWLSGWPVYAVAPSWMGFLLLTIAGERLELNRILSPSRATVAFFLSSGLAAASGALLASFGFLSEGAVLFTERGNRFHSPNYEWGVRLLGAGLLSLGVWLLSNDLARAAIRRPGLSRFMASSLLLGYVWLAASGALSLVHGGFVSGEIYDATLHSFFLGFVVSMVFAHGPVIFPAILGRPLRFHLLFYAPLALLHAGLAMRVLGDLTALEPWRRWGGLLNSAAILLFAGTVALGAARGESEGSRRSDVA